MMLVNSNTIIPEEIKIKIFQFSDEKDYPNFARVCNAWNAILKDNILWRPSPGLKCPSGFKIWKQYRKQEMKDRRAIVPARFHLPLALVTPNFPVLLRPLGILYHQYR